MFKDLISFKNKQTGILLSKYRKDQQLSIDKWAQDIKRQLKINTNSS